MHLQVEARVPLFRGDLKDDACNQVTAYLRLGSDSAASAKLFIDNHSYHYSMQFGVCFEALAVYYTNLYITGQWCPETSAKQTLPGWYHGAPHEGSLFQRTEVGWCRICTQIYWNREEQSRTAWGLDPYGRFDQHFGNVFWYPILLYFKSWLQPSM